MTTHIIVTVRREGTHSWPECPLEEVSFLRHPHRHLFHVRLWVPVTHDDRQLEIILVSRDLHRWLTTHYGDPMQLGRRSCEMLAHELLDAFGAARVEVLEDGEHGADVVA
jgi:hypothetical protein